MKKSNEEDDKNNIRYVFYSEHYDRVVADPRHLPYHGNECIPVPVKIDRNNNSVRLMDEDERNTLSESHYKKFIKFDVIKNHSASIMDGIRRLR